MRTPCLVGVCGNDFAAFCSYNNDALFSHAKYAVAAKEAGWSLNWRTPGGYQDSCWGRGYVRYGLEKQGGAAIPSSKFKDPTCPNNVYISDGGGKLNLKKQFYYGCLYD